MNAPVDDVGALIDRLGGLTRAAEAFGVRANVVGNWKARGKLPARRIFEHRRILEHHGIDASPSLWGFEDAA